MLLVSDLPPALIRAAAFVFGALWGSFFNVAIHRWPREMSVVTPPSHCPACGVPISAGRNVPIFGWIFLRGKAACCGTSISPRYPMVELITAVLAVALAERFVVNAPPTAALLDASIEALIYFAFVGGLIVASFVDLDWMEIPDEVSLPGAALGLATVTLRESPGAIDAALGAGVGFLLVQLVFVWGYERILGRRGMGEGDSKLLLMIGAFLGWQGAFFALVLGAFQGLIVAGLFLATGRSIVPAGLAELEAQEAEQERAERERMAGNGNGDASGDGDGNTDGNSDSDSDSDSDDDSDDESIGRLKVPYGPFLALGALEFLFFGNYLVERYIEYFFY